MRVRSLCLIFAFLVLAIPVAAMDLRVVTTTQTIQPIRIVTVPVTTATTTTPIGAISISSVPSGATVIIDGSVMGTTPYTLRTLSVGTHSLLLQLNGYQDYSTRFTITEDALNQQTYTLVPVTTATTAPTRVVISTTTTPPTTAVTPIVIRTPVSTEATPVIITTVTRLPTATPTPVPTRVIQQNTTLVTEFPRPVVLEPVTITIGNKTKFIRLSTMSPYLNLQLGTGGTGNVQAINPATMPVSYIEVDKNNVYLPTSRLMSNAEVAASPSWGDDDKVFIATTDKFYNTTNFRWTSMDKDATGFYQVSRTPFSANATEWQNQYVTGLVSSGPVKDVYVDSDGFHYFSLNFARIANHNPTDPPFYTGIAQIEETVPGKGTTAGIVRVPLTGTGIVIGSFPIGPVTLPYPGGILTIPAGEPLESEIGNPNANLLVSSGDSGYLRGLTSTEEGMLEIPQTYYVRVVPITKDGTAGVPTLPVTVQVVRPHPCPPNPPAGTESDIVVKPPSATVESFYMTSFVPDWIRTDQNGKLEARAHFVTVTSLQSCGNSSTAMVDSSGNETCDPAGEIVAGNHFYTDPQVSHWYDSFITIIDNFLDFWNSAVSGLTAAWNEAKDDAVIVMGVCASEALPPPYDSVCLQSPECQDAMRTAGSASLTAMDMTSNTPDVSDLQNMGADYMANVAADQLTGLTTLNETYGTSILNNGLPLEAQGYLRQSSGNASHSFVTTFVSLMNSAIVKSTGSYFIPDPLYYQAHPAIAIIRVSNTNDVKSDAVTMAVTDSAGLYKPAYKYVPTLAPHTSIVIPVLLEEDFSSVYTADCNENSYTSVCNGAGDTCIPCYWNKWYFAVLKSSQNGGDTFSVTLSTKKDGYYMTLTPTSSGTVLSGQNILTFDESGKSCGTYNAKTVLQYPSGWQMQVNNLKQDLGSLCWLKYTFTKGQEGFLINGTAPAGTISGTIVNGTLPHIANL